ncbi:hypothetical protein C8A01DRAFT_36874 [Parachaetomium inaequale]|uniref:Uncharacterized protein n=1 Tax=Parachaetomium inaequale TaxID=2588326 RepID=A0AAN6SQT4_9PEZI|nr:hypothetical protein C8A01DRAFT_36874 [Parachaetomium inaequale]
MYNNNPTHERGLRNPNHPGTTTTTAPNTNMPQPQTGLTYGQSPASGPAPTTAGHHKHDLLNKLDPRIDSTHDRQPMSQTGGGSSIPEGTYGPHTSKLANALDPRVDSDLDSARAGAGMGPGGGLGGTQAAGVPGAVPGAGMGVGVGAGPGMGGTQRGYGGEAPEGTYGPHTSRMANALDPRVDSDRDRHVGPGATHAPGAVMGGHGAMGTTSTATAGGGGGVGGAGAGVAAPHTAGPHKSNLLNKLDPRVDSQTGAWKGGSGTRAGY